MRAEFAKCDKCALNQGGFVGSVGPEKADIVFVGDLPNIYETFENKPFAGQSGQLMTKCLEYVGLDINDCFRTMAMLCSMPDKHKLKQAEMDCCRDRLIAEIKSREPKLVVIMGNTAVQAITRMKPMISKLRGQTIFLQDLDCQVLYMYHPAAILKSPKNFSDFSNDIALIPNLLTPKTSVDVVLDTDVKVYSDVDEAIKMLQMMQTKPYIACDIETTGFSFITDTIMCLALVATPGEAHVLPRHLLNNPIIRYLLRKLFEGPTKFIWQNGKFDVKFFRFKWLIRARVDEDTMLKHYCVDERRGTHDLETLSTRYLGTSGYKSAFREKLRFEDGLSFTPKQLMDLYVYCSQDTDYTFRVNFILDPLLNAEGNARKTYEYILLRASEAFTKIELTGIHVDKEYLKKIKEQYEQELEIMFNRMNAIVDEVGWDPQEYMEAVGAKKAPTCFNLKSPKQLGYVIFNLMGLPLFKRTRTTDKKAIMHWRSKVLKEPVEKSFYEDTEAYEGALVAWRSDSVVHDFIYSLTTYRKNSKIYDTYIMGAEKAADLDGRVHPTFKLIGTECVTGDSLIYTDEGMMYAEDICKGDEGFTEDTIILLAEQGELTTSHTYIGGLRDTREVKLGYGFELRGTPEHPVKTQRDWVILDQLQVGDYVKTSFGANYFPTFYMTGIEQAKLIGMFLSNGFTHYSEEYGSYFIGISNRDSLAYDILDNISKTLYDIPVKYDDSNGVIKIRSKSVTASWKVLFPHNGVANKKVPAVVRKFTREEWINFIEGCSVDSSWCLASNGKDKGKKALIRFNSVDKERLVLIHQVLWNLGIRASLLEIPYSTKNDVRRTGKYQALKQYQLNITSSQTLEYLKIFKPMTVKQCETADIFKQIEYSRIAYRNCKMIDDNLYVKVLSNELSGAKERVYDFTVPVHHNYVANGLVVHNTGRLACSDPNVQNLPRGPLIKNIFVARPGYILIQADFSQAELRCLAVLSGDPFLRNTYLNGGDLHDDVALELFGPGYTKEHRVRAKAVNFGLAYGRTEYTIAEEYGMAVADAREVIRLWFLKIPVAGQYIKDRRADPKRIGETIETAFGRKRRYPLITEDNAWNIENEAINFPISSTSSDCTVLSVIAMDGPIEEYGAYIVNEVHDSIVAEVPIENAYPVAKLMKEIMEAIPGKELNTDIPFVADIEIGFRYGAVEKVKNLEDLRIKYGEGKKLNEKTVAIGEDPIYRIMS